MFGPSLSTTGGMVSVVNGWKISGIEELVNLKYIPTIDYNGPGHYFSKLSNGIRSYIKYLSLRPNDYDLIHIHLAHGMSFYRKLLILLIGYFRKDLILVHLHGSDFEIFYTTGGYIQKKLISWMFNHATELIVLSEQWEKFVQGVCTNRNIKILYNGALPEQFKSYDYDSNTINILFMGELGTRKGTYDLINAYIPIYEEFPNANLILGGDGEVEKTRKMAKQVGIDDRVKLKGWLSGQDKIDAFENADIYVLPSYNEGLPVSILEAMAAGLPIISTPVGGISEAVLHGTNGYLVDPGDIESLSGSLAQLCRDRSLRDIMGNESLRLINNKFHLKKIVKDLYSIYDQVVSTKKLNDTENI